MILTIALAMMGLAALLTVIRLLREIGRASCRERV